MRKLRHIYNATAIVYVVTNVVHTMTVKIIINETYSSEPAGRVQLL